MRTATKLFVSQQQHGIDARGLLRGTPRCDEDGDGQQHQHEDPAERIGDATPYSSDAIARERIHAPAAPMTMPGMTTWSPSRKTTPRIWAGDAPSAVRMPNSRLRRLTA